MQRQTYDKASKTRWRQLWLAWHLYLGLTLGFVFTVAGFTGSLLVFYVELDEVLNPPLQISQTQSQQPKQSYEALFLALRAKLPERDGAWRLELPRHSQAMLMARYYKPAETEHLHFAPLIAWVNPYTAEVVSSRFWGEYLMTWLYDLHYTLLLDTTGKTIMGSIGLVLLIPLLTGIYLWWPKTGKFKAALSFKRGASTTRFVYDLHKTNGVYSFVLLLLLTVSGALLELPDVFNPLIGQLSPLFEAPATQSTYTPGLARIPLDQAAQTALAAYPDSQLRWLETPKNAQAAYRVMVYQAGEPSLRFPKTTVWVDQYSGKILATRDPKLQSAGDTFISWLHPLHSGEIAGLTGRWLVLFSGLVPCVLYVTGWMRWLQKRKAKQNKS